MYWTSSPVIPGHLLFDPHGDGGGLEGAFFRGVADDDNNNDDDVGAFFRGVPDDEEDDEDVGAFFRGVPADDDGGGAFFRGVPDDGGAFFWPWPLDEVNVRDDAGRGGSVRVGAVLVNVRDDAARRNVVWLRVRDAGVDGGDDSCSIVGR